jgi:hypothetical protein
MSDGVQRGDATRTCALPTTRYQKICESQRDSATKPRVGAQRQPWEHRAERPNPNGVASRRRLIRPEPRWGSHCLASVSQGSSCLATLGFGTKSLWDSENQSSNLWVMRSTQTVARGHPGRSNTDTSAVSLNLPNIPSAWTCGGLEGRAPFWFRLLCAWILAIPTAS